MASSGNFCTLNPLAQPNAGTYSEGNLLFTHTASAWRTSFGTHGMRTGKWYWEAYQYEDITTGNGFPIGIYDQDSGQQAAQAAQYPGQSNSSYGTGYIAYSNTGTYATKRNNGSETNMTIDDGDAGDVWQCAFDADNGKIWFGKNNTWDNSANPALGSNESYASIPSSTWVPITCSYSDSSSENYPQNFGQDSTFAGRISAGGNADSNGFGDFKYAPPTGFLALCSGNLPISDDIDPAQTDDNFPQKNFNVVTYTGTGSNGNNITGLGFQPDLVWFKNRSNGGGQYKNNLADTTRGISKVVYSDAENAEETNGDITSFDSDGFTVGGSGTYVNASSQNYVAWCWRANGGTTASNTDGDVTSTVQANQAAGFSIVEYVGNRSSAGTSTVGHGMGGVPDMFITKPTSHVGRWYVWHTGMSGASYMLVLNTSDAEADKSANGSMSLPTSSVFDITYTQGLGESGETHIGYFFRSIEGYSKFGKYEGNGNADGPFVYTGFRPRMLFIKRTDSAANWQIRDTARRTFNVHNITLNWDSNTSETQNSNHNMDILSNGYKLRTTLGDYNASGGTYIYGAWADVPFKYNNTF
jgi:hypothetical protein